MVPESKEQSGRITPRYLDERFLETPELAMAQATKEIMYMADNVQNMVRDIMDLVECKSELVLDRVMKWEEETDELFKVISRYLTDLAEHALNQQQSEKDVALLYVVNELENIGDVIESITRLSQKKMQANLEFSEQGKQELRRIHTAVNRQLEIALAAFTTNDSALATQAIREGGAIKMLEDELRKSHINRLFERREISRSSSVIHLDLLNYLQRISGHTTAIAYAVAGNAQAPLHQQAPARETSAGLRSAMEQYGPPDDARVHRGRE